MPPPASAQTSTSGSRIAALGGPVRIGWSFHTLFWRKSRNALAVQDHLKAIFAKTGARNRRTVVSRVAGR